MIKASLLLMLLLTVLVWFGLRWRDAQVAPPAAPPGRRKPRPPSLIARGKAGIDRWVTAAAIGAIGTIVLMGGLHWLRVFQQ
ncbi:hypothetical protein LPC08_08615 [Roseomonas sp. OT10]|uniref:hypothetical protein n=1 Tax=Roseomonas cutis TaxID=2897332 RepID=UPI001E2831CF|nr:hypothetical protein [Roseomonas sp. OT10]UFN50660.1 hypothetical protein LPC08_08615 [Roseomonas sp. OT10]